MPREEHAPLEQFFIQSFDSGDKAYPVVAVNVYPHETGYTVPDNLAACPDPRYPDHVFYSVAPTDTDQRVVWLYGIFPGPWIPYSPYNDLLGHIQGRKRAVVRDDATQFASKTATTKTTYEARDGSAIISWQIEETNSDGSGSAGNLAYPITVTNAHNAEHGDVETTTQATTDLTTDSSLVIGTRSYAGGSVPSGTTAALESLTPNAAGSTMVPGVTLTLVGGTFTTAAQLLVTTTKVVSAAIVYAGTGGAWTGSPSAYGIAATTGTGTKVILRASNNSGGHLATISVTGFGTNGGGSYTANPTNLASEPLATNPLNFPTDPPIVSLVMGVQTFSIAVAGAYSVSPAAFTSTGGGNNATFTNAQYTVPAAIETNFEPIDQFRRKKIVSAWALPAIDKQSTKVDEDGATITIDRQLVTKTVFDAISPREYISGGFWVRITSEAVEDKIVVKITEARPIPGTPIPSSRTEPDGVVTITKTLKDTTTITPGLTNPGGVLWTKISREPVTEKVAYEVKETKALPFAALTGEKRSQWGTLTTSKQGVAAGTAASTNALALSASVTPIDSIVSEAADEILPTTPYRRFLTEVEPDSGIVVTVVKSLVPNGTFGGVDYPVATNISAVSVAAQTVVTVASVAGLMPGMKVTVAATTTSPPLNGTRRIVAVNGFNVTLDFAVASVSVGAGTLILAAEIHREISDVNFPEQMAQLASQVDIASIAGAAQTYYTQFKYPWGQKLKALDFIKDLGTSGSTDTGIFDAPCTINTASGYSYGGNLAIRMSSYDGSCDAKVEESFSYGPPAQESEDRMILSSGTITIRGGSVKESLGKHYGATNTGYTIGVTDNLDFSIVHIPDCFTNGIGSITSSGTGLATATLKLNASTPAAPVFTASTYDWKAKIEVSRGRLGLYRKLKISLIQPSY